MQRIDGAAQNYGRDAEADLRQGKVNRLADLTIFQSQYARHSTREMFSVITQDGPIIHNPVDLQVFTPEGRRRKFPRRTQVACVTWSKNPLKGMSQVYEVAQRNPDVDFILCGSYDNAPDLKNVHGQGYLKRSDLAIALRSCHLLLTFSKNEACPNHVLEALASGLPVLFEDSGAMQEVIGDCGQPVSVESFPRQLEIILANLEIYSKTARQRAVELFDPQRNFSQYIDAINESLKRPTHLPMIWRSLLAWSYPARQRLDLA
ncbi:MAG: glycosyltransferase family 4 protein [Anaerolineales bacterium]